MLKILGVVIILVTIGAGIINWKEKRHKKREFLLGIYQLLCKGKYLLLEEQQKTTDFFTSIEDVPESVKRCCRAVGGALREHKFSRGEIAWIEAIKLNMGDMGLNREEKEVIFRSGCCFFGKNVYEMEKMFEYYQNQLLLCIKQERENFTEKNKMVIPLGVLGGLMVIIVFV